MLSGKDRAVCAVPLISHLFNAKLQSYRNAWYQKNAQIASFYPVVNAHIFFFSSFF